MPPKKNKETSLIDVIRYHSKVLETKSSALEIIHHAGDRGAEREDILQDFLEPLLPERIKIGRGEILATNGKWSRQEDLVLYDKLNCPRLFVGNRSQIFPIENVGAVIEVKSSLGAKEIKESTKNISDLRKLAKYGMSTHVGPGSISFGPQTPVLGCLFAYSHRYKKTDTFIKNWVKTQIALPPEERINLVCILNNLTIIHMDKVFHLWDRSTDNLENSIQFFESGKDSLLTFTLCLLRQLSETHFGTPDLFRYFFSGGSELVFPMKYFKKN